MEESKIKLLLSFSILLKNITYKNYSAKQKTDENNTENF